MGLPSWKSVHLCRALLLRTDATFTRWLFFIEGSLTVFAAVIAIFILPDFPTSSRWLSPEERELAIRRMAEDGGINVNDEESTERSSDDSENHRRRTSRVKAVKRMLGNHGSGAWLAVRDWRVWWMTASHFIQYWAISFFQFFPTLVSSLGYNRRVALILVAPPWIVTGVVAFFNSR